MIYREAREELCFNQWELVALKRAFKVALNFLPYISCTTVLLSYLEGGNGLL
jgi:hypothetical protein